MIHSLSGGVIADNSNYTFAKVDILGTPCWYIAPFAVGAGDRVLAPYGKEERLVEAIVLKTEVCSQQTAPVSVKRAKYLEQKL